MFNLVVRALKLLTATAGLDFVISSMSSVLRVAFRDCVCDFNKDTREVRSDSREDFEEEKEGEEGRGEPVRQRWREERGGDIGDKV